MPNTNLIGARTEGQVMAALLATGRTVLIPFSVEGYDLVFEDAYGFHRVQCKTAYMRGGAIVFDAYSKSGSLRDKKIYYQGRTDFFGIYCPHTQACYLIPISEVPGKEGCFRITPPRNGQTKGIRYAEAYRLK